MTHLDSILKDCIPEKLAVQNSDGSFNVCRLHMLSADSDEIVITYKNLEKGIIRDENTESKTIDAI